jgi:hypothetical protein
MAIPHSYTEMVLLNGETMTENEPGCGGVRHEHWNPRSSTKSLSAGGTAESSLYTDCVSRIWIGIIRICGELTWNVCVALRLYVKWLRWFTKYVSLL